MTIFFRGPSTLAETIGLTRRSPGCLSQATRTVCTESIVLASCPSKANCYRGVIVTYDKIECVRTVCTVPPGAHQLSANQDIAFSIAAGKKKKIPLTLDGIPVAVALVPLPPSTLSGSSSSGFTISKCVTTAQSVNVVGVDSDGDQIVGRGAPTSPTLSSNDTTHLAVATPAPSSPNTFKLVPPSSLRSATIPNPGHVVQLTAGVTPLAGSGASELSSHTSVTFNNDICGIITEYSIPTIGAFPIGIAAGLDALWFTEQFGNNIGRITTGGTISETPVPTSTSPPQPYAITAGPDGALWFTEDVGSNIGRIDAGERITNQYPIPPGGVHPFGIAAGSDNALWFTEANESTIGRITTGGTITNQYTTPTGGSNPYGIAAGPDGALWFVEEHGNNVGRITTGGSITETTIPTTSSSPEGIAAGSDGALWFTEFSGNKIGRITTGGTITNEYPIPTAGSSPLGIAAGPDGALWFTEFSGNKIGRITIGGIITNEYTIPTSTSEPSAIVAGPDGALWFTEFSGNNIGRLQ